MSLREKSILREALLCLHLMVGIPVSARPGLRSSMNFPAGVLAVYRIVRRRSERGMAAL